MLCPVGSIWVKLPVTQMFESALLTVHDGCANSASSGDHRFRHRPFSRHWIKLLYCVEGAACKEGKANETTQFSLNSQWVGVCVSVCVRACVCA